MIEVRNLSKDYKLKHKEPGLKGAIKGLLKPRFETVHAVKDLSFENPCVIKINETQWRMYFDVLIYDNKNKNFYKKIYKADTLNFDDWTDFQEIILKEHNNTILNSITPFVYLNDNNQYELYVSNKMGTEQINTIKCFIGNDGINFNYNMNLILKKSNN